MKSPALPRGTHSAAALLSLAGLAAATAADPPQEPAPGAQQSYERIVAPFLTAHCTGCHGADDPEGALNLAALDPDLRSHSAARWALVHEQLTAAAMPPEGSPPPGAAEIAAVTGWIEAELKRSGKHLARREAYRNGNAVAHHLLFDADRHAPLDVPPRIRTVSPEIYARFSGKLAKGFEELIGQPFTVGGGTTFRDMDLPRIDEPVTAGLIDNALLLAARQTGFRWEGEAMKPLRGTRKEFLPFVDEREPLGEAQIERAIRLQFAHVLQREPDAAELERFAALMNKNVAEAGRITGVRATLAAVFLLPEAIFRYELGAGPIDGAGRVRLTPREIAFALAYALTDDRPPGWLIDAAERGELDGDAQVAAAVRRMLDDPKLRKPRILRFFQEYFDYAKAVDVFKDGKAFFGHDPRALVEDADRLVEYVLEGDRQVLKELLTTNDAFVFHQGAAELKAKRTAARAEFERKRMENPAKFEGETARLPGRPIYESYNLDDFPDEQPATLPDDRRAGILTQPAWLVAHATADDNHAILRGKWVRERLLGGVVPDLPITVDAQLPDAPHHTLRQRMAVTREAYCWQCHRLMNRLGLPFELYDHFGRVRAVEAVLDPEATAANRDPKGKPRGDLFRDRPVDATGGFEFTLDPNLAGDVNDAVEMLRRLAESEVVEQVFVRHAFRYFAGRNETPGDAASLQAAHRAYRAADGSMQALIVSLLSSESFLYRVPAAPDAAGRAAPDAEPPPAPPAPQPDSDHGR